MDTKLDWLSFTFHWDNSDVENDAQARLVVCGTLIESLTEEVYDFMMGEGSPTIGKGRKPYSASVYYNTGTRIYFNHKLDHALVEISGEGCSRIFSQQMGEFLLQLVRANVTRLDVACDIETDVSPAEFASSRAPGRFKSFSHIQSDTGETCYIGSMSSNRYARVYKYESPHPRAGLLRVEHVFRQEDARKVIEFGFARGMDELLAQIAKIYGWTHDCWTIEPASERELTAHREEREDAATVKWLYDTVAPSIARLVKDNKLDLKSFLTHLYQKLRDDDEGLPVAQISD